MPSAPPSMIQTSESGGSGSIADNPPEYVAGFDGDIADLESEDMQLIKDFQWLSIYKKYKNLEGQEVKFLNGDDFHKNMEQFAREHPEIEQLTKQDARTGRVLVWCQVKSGDGYDVYYDVTANGAIASTDPMWTGSLKVTREKVHFQGKPDFRMGDDGHWYGFTIDGNGTATHWFSTNGATVDNAEEKMVEVEREMEKVYTSCVDPELQQNILQTAIEELGDLGEYIGSLSNQIFEKQDLYVPKHTLKYSDMIFVGSSKISPANLHGFNKDDRAYCVYFSDDDTSQLVPIVIAFTINDNFHRTTIVGNPIDETQKVFNFYSEKELDDWLRGADGGLAIGDVFRVDIQTFRGVSSIDDISKMELFDLSRPEDVKIFLQMIGADDYIKRIGGPEGSIVDMAKRLSKDKGDVGLIPGYLHRTSIRQ